MNRLQFAFLLAVLGMLLSPGLISAQNQVPSTMSYQGRLTDDAGDPVEDDQYSLVFTIYDDVGTVLWTESQKVNTSDGLFTALLGSNGTPLTADVFSADERYLGIAVEPDPELTPRTPLVTVPYSFVSLNSYQTATVDGASGGTITSDITVLDKLDVGSPSVDGNLCVYQNGSTDPIVEIDEWAGLGGRLVLRDEAGENQLRLEMDTDGDGGFLWVGSGYYGRGIYLYGNTASSRNPSMLIDGALSETYINTNETGDNSVQLPNDAVHSAEMLNEAGLASQVSSTTRILETSMQDLETVTITIPASGYIHLMGQCYVRTYGSTNDLRIYIQIDETSGGSYETPYVTGAGMSSFNSSSASYYWPVFVQRVYYKEAGTYTFRLEGMHTDDAHTSSASQYTLTALYFPTAYGTVSSIVSDPSGFTNTETVSTSLEDDADSETAFEVDLRELELRAARLREAALEAERAYEVARSKQNVDDSTE